jgi:CHAT domain-containing protein
LTVYRREALPYNWAQAQRGLGNAYANRVRGKRADNLEAAIAYYEAALTVQTYEALPRDHLKVSRMLGEAQLDRRDWHSALSEFLSARQAFLLLFGQGLDEAEARGLISDAGPLFSGAAYAAIEAGDLEGAFRLLDEGKARLLAVALRQQGLPLSPDLQVRLAHLRREIRKWLRLTEMSQGSKRTDVVAHLSTLRRELGKLIEDALSKLASPASLTQRAAQLAGTNGAIVAPVVTSAGGKMLVVSRSDGQAETSIRSLDLPDLTITRLNDLMWGSSPENELGGWFGAYFRDQWPTAIEAVALAIWHLLGDRLSQELERVGIREGGRLIWLPTGALGILPIGLAGNPITGERLGETYEIVYAPSIDALSATSITAETGDDATLAAIAPSTDLSSTLFEVEIIARHFQEAGRILVNGGVTADVVLSALRGRKYWHFASHGKFDWEEPRRSHLKLENNETLSVGMLSDAEDLTRPRLVVLSACETGIYEFQQNADEFIGLPGAFMAIGAAGVLGSLWPVEDRATALLMAKFYDLHLDRKKPLSPPTALKYAQTWLRTATKANLIAFAQEAGKSAGAEALALAFETSLQRASSDHPRWAAVTKLIQEIIAKSKLSPGWFFGEHIKEDCPFAHPYYWGGFIYTGT